MAALQYVSDEAPGIRRVRRGRGFQYVGPRGNGSTVDRERIDALAIPPAWTDVWICPDPNGHIQATGRDAKGRKQYRYHPRWRQTRDRHKYQRIAEFGEALPELRKHVDAQLDATGPLDADRVVSLVIALLDETLIRIGNSEYAHNGSHGLTTLTGSHVQWGRGALTFSFPGKSGKWHEVDVEDPRLARLVRRCHQLGGQQLFTYRTADGSLGNVSSGDVNDALRAITGLEVTAKDFRTWGGTAVVTEHLATAASPPDEHDVLAAIDTAAAQLGNTRAVCRASYVHPRVLAAAKSGLLHDVWLASSSRRYLRRAEVTLLGVIGD